MPLRKELRLRGRGAHYIRMLVIRLFRVGKKNQPSFKIVVTDKKKPVRAGRFVEQVGFYNPLTKEKVLKGDRIKYWLSVGAKPSDTIFNLLVSEKLVDGKKIASHKKSKKEAGEPAPAEQTEKESIEATKPEPQKEEPKEEIKETSKTEPEAKKEAAEEKQAEIVAEAAPAIEETVAEEIKEEKVAEEEKATE